MPNAISIKAFVRHMKECLRRLLVLPIGFHCKMHQSVRLVVLKHSPTGQPSEVEVLPAPFGSRVEEGAVKVFDCVYHVAWRRACSSHNLQGAVAEDTAAEVASTDMSAELAAEEAQIDNG